MKTPTNHSSQSIKIYYLRNRILYLVMGILGILFPVFAVVRAKYLQNIENVILLILFFGFLSVVVISHYMTSRVEITSSGIHYYQPGYSVQANWSDIESIQLEPYPMYSLMLRKSSFLSNTFVKSLVLKFGPYDKAIPLSPYITDELDKEIRLILPELFNKE